jgi:hypothetical protein
MKNLYSEPLFDVYGGMDRLESPTLYARLYWWLYEEMEDVVFRMSINLDE